MDPIFDYMTNSYQQEANDMAEIWNCDYFPEDLPLFPTLSDFIKLNHLDVDLSGCLNTDYCKPNFQKPSDIILHHDCMWSGTCVDKEHPKKKKAMNETLLSDMNNFHDYEYVDSGKSTDASFNSVSQDDSKINPKLLNIPQQSSQVTLIQQAPQNLGVASQLPQQNELHKIYQTVFATSKPGIVGVKYEATEVKSLPPSISKYYLYPVEMPAPIKQEAVPYPQRIKLEPQSPPLPIVPKKVALSFKHSGLYNISNNNNSNFIQDSNFPSSSAAPENETVGEEAIKPKKKYQSRKLIKTKSIGGKYVLKKKRQKITRSNLNLFLDDSDTPIQKRSIHNCLERQRRIGLRNLFIELKEVIPMFDEKERVPKVNILKEAAAYCKKLRYEEAYLSELKKINGRLKKHLNQLITNY